MSGDGREDVAAVERVRDRLQSVRRVADLDHFVDRSRRRDQQPVVGADEDAVAGADRDRSSLRSDAGVDDGEVDAGRRERQRPREPS